jgi:hypothetical protein
MNEERFSDLAVKFCAGKCTDAERAELDTMIASAPELKGELEKMQADVRLAREVLPLLAATQSSSGEFPAYARERLQTKVRETLGRPGPAQRRTSWNWRWVLGVAGVTAVVFLLLTVVLFPPGKPLVQVAMLDTSGAVRGEDNDLKVLKQAWNSSVVQTFEKASDLENWQVNWPVARVSAKVIYNRAAGEVHVIVRSPGQPREKTFLVERNLAETLRQADEFIRKQAGK